MANSTVQKTVSANKTAIVSAAILETGRIANNKAIQLVSKQLPLMVRGYADTAFGKLAIANVAVMAVNQFRPDNEALQRISNGMVVAAYQELLQTIDIEGFLDSLLGDATLAKSLAKLEKASTAVDED